MSTQTPAHAGDASQRRRTRSFALPLLVLCALAVLAGAFSSLRAQPAAAAGEPPDVVYNRFRAALNLPDLDKASLYMADSFRFTLGYESAGKRTPLRADLPPTAFKQLLGSDRYTIVVTSETVNGNTATGRFEEVYPRVIAAGVDRVVANYQVVVADGKITSYVVYLDTADAQTAKFVASILPPSQTPAPPATGSGVAPSRTHDAAEWALAGVVLLLAGAAVFRRSGVARR